jgi:hypothetical protein
VATRALRDPAPLVALSHRQRAINPEPEPDDRIEVAAAQEPTARRPMDWFG